MIWKRVYKFQPRGRTTVISINAECFPIREGLIIALPRVKNGIKKTKRKND